MADTATSVTSVAMSSDMSPVFGPELGTYMRMWYGTRENRFAGITPGRFYDFRAFPVPYTPLTETTFQLNIDTNDGELVHIRIVRENPAPEGVTDEIYTVVTAPVTIFGVRLSKGLNTLTASINGVDVAQTSVTSLIAATYMYSLATNIYSGFWAKANSVENDIFSVEPTLLTAPLLAFDELFSSAANWNRMARGLVVNALMNSPGSSQAIQALTQSVLFQSPVISRVRSPLTRSWLRGIQDQAWAVNGRTMHIWGPDAWTGRYAAALAIARKDQVITGRDFIGDRDTGDFTNLYKPTEIEFEARRSWLSMADSADVSDLEFTAHSCTHGQIQFPGLLDTPPVHLPMESTGYVPVDPAPNLFIGRPITPTPLFGPAELPMSTLDKVIEAFAVSLETHGLGSYVDVFAWASQTNTVANATAAGWIASTYGPGNVTENPTNPTDPGVNIGLADLGAGHTHANVLLNAQQRARVKAGIEVVVMSGAASSGPAHTHRLTLNWETGYLVTVGNQHGHYATAVEFPEVGVP